MTYFLHKRRKMDCNTEIFMLYLFVDSAIIKEIPDRLSARMKYYKKR